MKVLVTGSSGHLGGEIINLLRYLKIKSIGCDLLPSPTTNAVMDIRDRKEVFKMVKKADHIIHTAALHGKHSVLGVSRQDFVETNINGTLHLLDASVANKVKSVVFTSTTSVYGASMADRSQAVWVDEELIPSPRDIYDITKLAAENLCRDFFDKEKLNVCTIRISRFLNEPLNVTANHRLYRGLDVTDGAEAHWLALNKKFKNFEVFNISSKSPFQKHELKKLKTDPRSVILKYYPQSEVIYRQRKWKFPKSIDRVYAVDKAMRMLNYRPKINFMEYLSL